MVDSSFGTTNSGTEVYPVKEDPVSPPLWVAAAQKIQDRELRQTVVQAAQRNWPRMVAYSKAQLEGAVDPAMVLDGVVDAALEANRKKQIRDFGPYLFKAFVRRAKLLLQRGQRVEYLDPEDLAALNSASDASFVENLEHHIQLEEAVSMMDEGTRAIYSMRVQGLSLRQIGARLGMSEDAVRKDFARGGIERVKRRIAEGPKNDPNR
ncbi:MAG TPA: sigma-70 family RNA polymerase sigma factor [Terriglobia bacterium]|nr:sigma-70 family RNA polymerase sigma factor [Terriglobia bacterium]